MMSVIQSQIALPLGAVSILLHHFYADSAINTTNRGVW